MRLRAALRLTACALLASALTGAFSTQAFAQIPFDITGVTIPDAGSSERADPFGNIQELGAAQGSSTKVGVVNRDAVPTLDFTNPNGQTDLRKVWLQTRAATNGHVWLYFAWERDANSGSGVIAFEFQKAAKAAACSYAGLDMINPAQTGETTLINGCNPWAGRQAGDFMILWDQSGGSKDIYKRTFTGTAPNLTLGPAVLLPAATSKAEYSPDGFRGEAAVNLTVEIFGGSNACTNFANVLPSTITGNSDSADYKDTVLTTFPTVSNCGTVTVKKVTTRAGGVGDFPYLLKRADNSDIFFTGTNKTSVSATLVNDQAMDTIENLIAGTNYTLAENLATNSLWKLKTIVCGSTDVTAGGNFTVAIGETTACVITNEPKEGTITVKKFVNNNFGGSAGPGAFNMNINVAGHNPFAGSNAGTPTTLAVGTSFYVTESSVPGYTQESAVGSCGTAVTPIVIADGDNLTCTITNTDVPAHLIIIKHVINDNGGTKAASEFTLTIGGVTAQGGQNVTGAESPGVDKILTSVGAYTVTEVAPAGYTQSSSADCSGTIALGETKTCTITNDDKAGTLIVRKVVINDNGGTRLATGFGFQVNGGTLTAFADDPAANPQNQDLGKNTLEVAAGTYNVTEPDPTSLGYAMTSNTCVNVVVANGEEETCVITNDDAKAAPGGETDQKARLHDSITITGIRPNSPGTAASVTFQLYTGASCQNGGTTVGSPEQVTVSVNGTTGTAATVNGVEVDPLGSPSIAVYSWRVSYSGDQFNAPFSDCNEKADLTFTPK